MFLKKENFMWWRYNRQHLILDKILDKALSTVGSFLFLISSLYVIKKNQNTTKPLCYNYSLSEWESLIVNYTICLDILG